LMLIKRPADPSAALGMTKGRVARLLSVVVLATTLRMLLVAPSTDR
jgi:hypothetical protein